MIAVRRGVLAGVFAVPLAAAGLLAAAVAAGAPPPLVTGTTGATGTIGTTTTSVALIAAGVTVGGVPIGGLTPDDAYDVVSISFARPLAIVIRDHRLAPQPAQLGASARIGEAIARAGSAAPGSRVPLEVVVKRARVHAYVAALERRFDIDPVNARLFLRNLRPWIAKPVVGLKLYARRAEAAIVSALVANKRGPLRLQQKVMEPVTTRANFGAVIVIRRTSNRLYLYNGMRQWRLFQVATGQSSYPTPLGRFHIVVKWRNPWWYPPSSPWARGLKPIPPGPGNPLGTRWMGLSAPGVGIHGTPDATSIGYSASHGCIRMRIPDAEWLFQHVRIGTTVFIVAA
jgi:lipoprotein-anchoring transpeptidase ErfK/SrfK